MILDKVTGSHPSHAGHLILKRKEIIWSVEEGRVSLPSETCFKNLACGRKEGWRPPPPWLWWIQGSCTLFTNLPLTGRALPLELCTPCDAGRYTVEVTPCWFSGSVHKRLVAFRSCFFLSWLPAPTRHVVRKPSGTIRRDPVAPVGRTAERLRPGGTNSPVM